MRKYISFVVALMLVAIFPMNDVMADELLRFDNFALQKLDGVTYYTRDSDIADDPKYKTTYGYLAENFDEFVAAAFNDKYDVIIEFHPAKYDKFLSSRDCITEIMNECYSEDAGMFDDSFIVYPHHNYLYEFLSVNNYGDTKNTYDSYYVVTYDGIIELTGNCSEQITNAKDYSYNDELIDFVHQVAMSVHAKGLMKKDQ